MLVPAPGRFSMTNVWPSRSVSHCPIRRATMSLPPAGVKPTIKRTARIGVRERAASNGGRDDSARRQLEKLPAEKVHDNAPGPCERIDANQQSDTTFAKSAKGGNDRS